ncbi:MAG: phytanoyl-CoA dioxygenase family protein [Planctomycetes bacterium]|nr:phytanoyl-CoA dioxygenase family protein [Planctomycetota bacterium]
MGKRLNKTDIDSYRSEGYLLVQQPIMESHEFNALSKEFEGIADQWESQHQIRPEHIDVPHLYHPSLYRWLCNDQILDLVEDIVGPDIMLFSSHFIAKPAGNGQRVPWHEDSAYWAHYNIEPIDIVTVWLAIDDSDLENGCMSIIPGSHLTADSAYADLEQGDHSVFSNEITSDQFDESTAVPCILKKNQASLHHGKLIHGSEANNSDRRRCGYTMRFMSTKCKINNLGDHHVFLVRGQDHAGNTYSDMKSVLREHATTS